jgi:hypothetical protein
MHIGVSLPSGDRAETVAHSRANDRQSRTFAGDAQPSAKLEHVASLQRQVPSLRWWATESTTRRASPAPTSPFRSERFDARAMDG